MITENLFWLSIAYNQVPEAKVTKIGFWKMFRLTHIATTDCLLMRMMTIIC